MRMTHLEIPPKFHRNSPRVMELGVENTGEELLKTGCELLGWPDLADKDVLDVGCGVRFTQAIINRNLPIKSYAGVDINEPLVNFLATSVKDDRFSFAYWNIYNEMYNKSGEKLAKGTKLPIPDNKKFDLVWMYSVITHNYPADTEALFHILRTHIRPGGALVFSAFLDNNLETFEDKLKDQPLCNAYYNQKYLTQLLTNTRWEVQTMFNQWKNTLFQNLFVCRPKRRFWELF